MIKAYMAYTTLDATKAMIGAIDNSDFYSEHIVVVPDKFSLQMEKMLLSTFKQKALFNVKVMGLSSLAVSILSKLNLNSDILSNGECLLLTQNAIESVKDEFLTFKKCSISFCHEMYKLIAQLKSSRVQPEDLNVKAGAITGEKYHDIALIYKKYNELLSGHMDANERLNLAISKLQDGKILENTSFYFAQFDSFTTEGYDLIKALAKVAKDISVSIATSKTVGNDYIYEKDIFQKLSKFATEEQINIAVIEASTPLPPAKEAIIRGVYSYDRPHCKNNGFYFALTSTSISNECQQVAKLIHYYITKGYNYKDIVVACGNFEKVKKEIENCFQMFDLPCYIDSSVSANETILSKFIFSLFEVVLSGFSQESLTRLLSCKLLGNELELIEFVQKYAVDNRYKYKKYIENDFSWAEIIRKIENGKTAQDFQDIISTVCEKCEQSYSILESQMMEKNYIVEQKINSQAKEIIFENILLISKYKNNITLDEYVKTLKLLLTFKQVSTVPSYCDAVMVADAQEGFFDESKILFIIGAQALPVVNNDNGLLNDDDISLNFASKKIEPTIRMINRRNRFKIFNLLTTAQEKLIISYQFVNEEGKKNESPTFVENLNAIFSQRPIALTWSSEELAQLSDEIFLLTFGNRKSFIIQYSEDLSDIDKNKLNIPNRYFIKSDWHIKNAKELYFADGKIRVTQLENYFVCPFRHFATYGLKLKEKTIYQFDALDFGNVCHSASQLFVDMLIKNNYILSQNIDDLIELWLPQIIAGLSLNEKLEATSEKGSLLNYVKLYLKNLFQDIYFEIQNSYFKPKFTEQSVQNIRLGKYKLALIGKADRIDFADDYFRIIDYKTGQTGNIRKDLFYGNKLQLFLYMGSFEKLFQKQCAGVFYFNAKTQYLKSEEERFLLKGLVQNDQRILKFFDKSIENGGKSKILAISNENGEYHGQAIAKEDLADYVGYAKNVAGQGADEICEGYIEPKPIEDACKNCPFKAVCGFEKGYGERKQRSNFAFLGDTHG